jgi:ATP synthase protein I
MDEETGRTASEAGSTNPSFEQRLEDARRRQGLDPAPVAASTDPETSRLMGVFLRVGVEMIAGLLVGLAIGYGLDRWLGTRPLFIIVFVLLGGAAGMLNVWRIVAPTKAL